MKKLCRRIGSILRCGAIIIFTLMVCYGGQYSKAEPVVINASDIKFMTQKPMPLSQFPKATPQYPMVSNECSAQPTPECATPSVCPTISPQVPDINTPIPSPVIIPICTTMPICTPEPKTTPIPTSTPMPTEYPTPTYIIIPEETPPAENTPEKETISPTSTPEISVPTIIPALPVTPPPSEITTAPTPFTTPYYDVTPEPEEFTSTPVITPSPNETYTPAITSTPITQNSPPPYEEEISTPEPAYGIITPKPTLTPEVSKTPIDEEESLPMDPPAYGIVKTGDNPNDMKMIIIGGIMLLSGTLLVSLDKRRQND